MLPVIMAGGEGSRLRPLTETTPKPLLPLDGIPVIVRLLSLLADAGFSRAVVTVRYLGEKIIEALGDTVCGVRLLYLKEDGEKPLGTAGSVRAAAEQYLENETDLLVLSGDAVTNADLPAFCRFHEAHRADASLLSVRVDEPGAYGTILSDAEGRVTGFCEKPSAPETVTDAVNTGIYLLSRQTVSEIPSSGAPDFGQDVFPRMLEGGKRLYVCHADCFWCDIGAFGAFLSCALDAAAGKLPGVPAGGCAVRRFPGNSIGAGCFLSAVTSASDTSAADASVRECALLGNVTVGAGASVLRSIVGFGVKIGRAASVGAGCVIGDGAVLEDGAVLLPGTCVPAGAHIFAEAPVSAGDVISSPGEKRRFFSDGAAVFPRTGDGYLLSRLPGDVSGAALLPDISRCVRFGETLARFAPFLLSQSGETPQDVESALPVLVFLRTDEGEALAAAETFVLESARLSCGGTCRILHVTGVNAASAACVTAADAARDPSLATLPELSRAPAVLRVLFCRTETPSGAALSLFLADRYGKALDRKRERQWERLLSSSGETAAGANAAGANAAGTTASAKTASAGTADRVCVPENLSAAVVMTHFRHTLLSGTPLPAPGAFPYRIDRAAGRDTDTALLSGIFAAAFGPETPDAPTVLSLSRDPESGGTLPAVSDKSGDGVRISGQWELLALWLSSQRGRAVSVPVTAPLWLDGFAARAGAVLVRTPEELRTLTRSCTDAPEGLRLLLAVCALAAERAGETFPKGEPFSPEKETLSRENAPFSRKKEPLSLSKTPLSPFAAFRSAVLGRDAPTYVRVRREEGERAPAGSLPGTPGQSNASAQTVSDAAAVRRLCEEASFVPAGEGVLSRHADGSTVRVSRTRAHTLRITADAYSSEQAEELLSETEALLARMRKK